MIKADYLTKPIYCFLFLVIMVTGTFPEVAPAGLIKKKVKPRPETWHTPSPPIKTPSESSIVADPNPYQQCKATVMPAFISRSMGMNETSYRAFKALSPPSILVNAAGNSYPQPVSKAETKASRDYNAIIVGSMSPDGIKSRFSQEGEAVHILAPSDHYLTSATSTGHYRKYGGTSGATPLVTGSLAGFEWMAGYHLTAEEAKIVLAKTAIPTPYSKDKPQKNGVGMVNAYKLAMVGKQLKQVCGKNIACFKDLIKKDDIYQFPEDEAVGEALDKAFPYCSSTCTAEDLKTAPSCADKAKAFKDLRKQAFLNPQNKELWKKIACVYAQGGFGKNKAFALSIYNTLSGKPPNGDTKTAKDYCQKDVDCVLVAPCDKKNIAHSFDGLMSKSGVSNSDKDSALDEQNTGHLLALNRAFQEEHYLECMESNGKIPLCNNKCRCNSQESITKSASLATEPVAGEGSSNEGSSEEENSGPVARKTTNYSVSCVDFQCLVSMSGSEVSAPVSPPLVEQEPEVEPASGGGGALQ